MKKMMNPAVQVKVFFASLVMIASLCSFDARAQTIQTEVEPPLGAKIDITIILPTEGRTPRAVILAIPGGGGIGDADLEIQLLASQKNRPTVRSLLPYILSARQYAYVYFNYGGILSRLRCIDPALPRDRLTKFLKKCLDRKLNRRRGFSTTDHEIAAVWKSLSRVPEIQGVPVIILAFSEGAQHTARLIRSGRISVDGFVGVGAPTVSPAENLRSQLTRKLRYRRINFVLDQNHSNVLRVADLPELFQDDRAIEYLQWSLRSQALWTRGELAQVENMDVSLSTQAFESWWQQNRDRPLTVEYYGTAIENFTSPLFFQEQLDDEVDMARSLLNFHGKSVFLYGEFDTQVDFSLDSACGDTQPPKCRVTIVPKAGHSFMVPENRFLGLDQILDAIESVDD